MISHVTDLHPSKALRPTVTFLSVLLITKSRLLQLRNALSPIFVTLDGIDTSLFKFVQPAYIKFMQSANALSPMFVTPDGIVMSANFMQPANTPLPMLVTLDGIFARLKLVP